MVQQTISQTIQFEGKLVWWLASCRDAASRGAPKPSSALVLCSLHEWSPPSRGILQDLPPNNKTTNILRLWCSTLPEHHKSPLIRSAAPSVQSAALQRALLLIRFSALRPPSRSSACFLCISPPAQCSSRRGVCQQLSSTRRDVEAPKTHAVRSAGSLLERRRAASWTSTLTWPVPERASCAP